MNPRLQKAFHTLFGASPSWLVKAPGRVNLIGEHTDYNDGFVLPMAIEQNIQIALRPRSDTQVVLHSLDYHQTAQFDLKDLQHSEQKWLDYVIGVAWALQQEGVALLGWEGVITGDVPRGAGLSSSAALEIAAARAFAALANLEINPVKLARLAQKAENEWVGVRCGIMDQMASVCTQAGHALLLDCRTLAYQHIPLPAQATIVILDTATRRGLVDSAYNERRAQCEQAARLLGVPALRDATLEQLETIPMEAITRKRAYHVISENQRVLQSVEALQQGDLSRLGHLLYESHLSLRNDFEVSSPALDAMVEIALQHPACYGARMTGAGFGGCAIALVKQEQAHEFALETSERYTSAVGLSPAIYITKANQGAQAIRLT
ncbi:MAG: galactokinase [Anaerolineales bacterium]|nr:galactokinase [Anaerolineales bacterium]MCX7607791.1 galactokinase [Anaerolineales bacterium]MDW8226394.1 galactokinase [Anaerolineales bacterium]